MAPEKLRRTARSFFRAGKVVSAPGKQSQAIAAELAEYERNSSLQLRRRSRPSARKAVAAFGGFCFKQRANLGFRMRDPDALLTSLLDWFDRSEFIDILLKHADLSREGVELALEIIVDDYDDLSIAETLLSDWTDCEWVTKDAGETIRDAGDVGLHWILNGARAEKAEAQMLIDMAHAVQSDRVARQLERAAEEYENRERRQRAALVAAEEALGRRVRTRKSGRKLDWFTPALDELEATALCGASKPWNLLAELVREIEGTPSTTPRQVRNRVNDFRRRQTQGK